MQNASIFKLDQIVFCLTERLNESIKLQQRELYLNEIKPIFLQFAQYQNDPIPRRDENIKLFFKKLVYQSACDCPNKFLSSINKNLNNLINQNDQEILNDIDQNPSMLDIYNGYKNTIIENLFLEDKINEYENYYIGLQDEFKIINEKYIEQTKKEARNRGEELEIKKGEVLRSHLHLIIDDLNRQFNNPE